MTHRLGVHNGNASYGRAFARRIIGYWNCSSHCGPTEFSMQAVQVAMSGIRIVRKSRLDVRWNGDAMFCEIGIPGPFQSG
jgi:hypothetical protein